MLGTFIIAGSGGLHCGGDNGCIGCIIPGIGPGGAGLCTGATAEPQEPDITPCGGGDGCMGGGAAPGVRHLVGVTDIPLTSMTDFPFGLATRNRRGSAGISGRDIDRSCWPTTSTLTGVATERPRRSPEHEEALDNVRGAEVLRAFKLTEPAVAAGTLMEPPDLAAVASKAWLPFSAAF